MWHRLDFMGRLFDRGGRLLIFLVFKRVVYVYYRYVHVKPPVFQIDTFSQKSFYSHRLIHYNTFLMYKINSTIC